MDENFIMKNVSEDLIEMMLDDCMENSAPCRCARCRADVFAHALNHMPLQYVVATPGDIFLRATSLSHQYKADVVAAVTKGIMAVSENPRH